MSNKSLIMYIGTAISCVLQFLIYKLHSTDQDGINNTVYWRYRACTGIILNVPVPYRTTQEEERIGLTTRTPRKYDLERIKEQKMTAAVRYKYRYLVLYCFSIIKNK